MPLLAKLPILRCLKRYDAVLFAVALAMVLWFVLAAEAGFPLDDSWIHQVYGRNLALTGAWAFVPGQVSAASTSPLYTIILSLGYRLGVDYRLWTHSLGVLALWLTGVLAARWAERWAAAFGKRGGWWRHIGVTAGLFQVGAWHLLWAAASGMETALFGMWTLALLLAMPSFVGTGFVPPIPDSPKMAEEGSRGAGLPRLRSVGVRAEVINGILFGLCAGLATLTRPEGVALAGLIGLAVLLVRPHGDWRRTLIWGAVAALCFALVIAPYALFNLRVTGGLLPDTAAAKQAEYADLLRGSLLTRVLSLLTPLVAGVQLLLVPAMLMFVYAVVKRARQNWRVLLYLLPLLWAGGLVLLYALRLPTPYQHGRYVIPALPALILSGVCGLAYALDASRRSLIGRVLARAAMAGSIAALVYFALLTGAAAYRRDVQIINQEMVTTAHWVAEHLPADALLAVHDIGALGYFAPRPILDLAGLVSPEVAPFIRRPEQLWAWMQAGGAAYLMAFPDQIPGGDAQDPRLCRVFESGGAAAPAAGGSNMAVYRFAWNNVCP